MKLVDLCSNFDIYEIVDNQTKIDREFYSISEIIHSDGTVESNVNAKGYIHITSVANANYLMFIDTQHKLYLCIYKYIPETKFKAIIREMNSLRKIIDEYKHNDPSSFENSIHVDDDLIDINLFTCTECDSDEKMVFVRSKTNPEALETTCKVCKTEYTLVPSKYYKLSSKRVVYFKSEVSSRQIDIEEPKQNKSTINNTDIKVRKKFI